MPELSTEITNLIDSRMHVANSIAYKMWRVAPHVLELDDLKASAYYGLVKAATRWESYCLSCHDKDCIASRAKAKLPDCDPPSCDLLEHQFSISATEFFTNFAVKRMRGAIIDDLRSQDWASRAIRTKVKALQKVDQGQSYTEEELAEKTGLSVREVKDTMLFLAQRPISLDGAPGVFEAQVQDTESVASGHDMLSSLVHAFYSCTPEEQVVLALHYHQKKELQEIAKIMGVTGTHVSKLHTHGVLLVYKAMVDLVKTQDQD